MVQVLDLLSPWMSSVTSIVDEYYNYRIMPSGRGFRIAALSVDNVLAHIAEIRILLAEYALDIPATNETKLKVSQLKSSLA